GSGPQIGRAARKLRRDHAGAQRMHAGEKGITPRRAALLGIVVGKLRAFLSVAVDVRRFPDHQALVIDAWLHPADIIAHDEKDVGLLLLLRSCWQIRPHTDGDGCKQSGPKLSHEFHGKPPDLSGFVGISNETTPQGDWFIAEARSFHA